MRKKDKLYTANKWNQPLFANVDRTTQNIFDGKPSFGSQLGSQMKGEALGSISGALIGAAQGATQAIGNAIGNGYHSKAGDLIANIPGLKLFGEIGNRLWGVKANEGNINAIQQNTANMQTIGSNLSGATTTDDILNLAGMMSGGTGFSTTDLYKGGVFAKNKARRRAQKLLNAEASALAMQNQGLATGINNVDQIQDDNVLANFAAYGGPLGILGNVDNMGAIEYGLMSDWLDTKREKNAAEKLNTDLGLLAEGGKIEIKHPGRLTALKKRTGKTEAELWAEGKPEVRKMITFARNARKWSKALGGYLDARDNLLAFGGDLETNIADYPTGLTHIDAGGSHEENPYDGVQMGTDAEGTPNLVEEGEVIFNDYVYSKRIPCDETTKKAFHIGKKREISYADLAKKLEKEIQEHPNDPISKAGFKAQMDELADHQERQKQEMEAERARVAFESLSPEEKVAVMQQAAQQEVATMQQPVNTEMPVQPTEEEAALMQQQMQAEGSQANLGEEPNMNAKGGRLYDTGGPTINSYAYDRSWDGFKYFNPETGEYDPGYLNFVNNLNEDWIGRLLNGEYGPMSRYLATNKNTVPTLGQIRALATDKKYSDMHKTVGNAYEAWLKEQEFLNDNKSVTPTPDATPIVPPVKKSPVANGTIYHALEGDENYIQGDLDPNIVGEESSRRILDNGDTVIYHKRADAGTEGTTRSTEEGDLEPVHRWEELRYAGLFGPAVGLGMMAAGVGKPKYGELDGVLDAYDRRGASMADYRPIGNYLRYTPMDIWAEQNRLDANARATDRALSNNAAPIGTRMAGLLANAYNNQLASGQLYRQALEYNDNKRHQVADFNRATDIFNANAYNSTSQFNAEVRNQDRATRANLAAQIAGQKMDADAGWYNSLYGNVSGLFRGLSDLGRENADRNWRNRLAVAGVFGNMDDDRMVQYGLARRRSKEEGGKITKRKGKRGLTF